MDTTLTIQEEQCSYATFRRTRHAVNRGGKLMSSTMELDQIIQDSGTSLEQKARETIAEAKRSSGLLGPAVANMPKRTLDKLYDDYAEALRVVREAAAPACALGQTRMVLSATAGLEEGREISQTHLADDDLNFSSPPSSKSEKANAKKVEKLAQSTLKYEVPKEPKVGIRSFFATGSGEGIAPGARSEYGELQARSYWARTRE